MATSNPPGKLLNFGLVASQILLAAAFSFFGFFAKPPSRLHRLRP
jgi:hypothetical protein